MATTKISGYSDDLIEIEGQVREEFVYNTGKDEVLYLTCSDGTVLDIEYTDSGVWRIRPVVRGSNVVTIEQAVEDDEENYSDIATIIGDLEWVGIGNAVARAKD